MERDPSSHAIVLQSDTTLTLPTVGKGPLASMVGDALSLVVCKEPRPAEERPRLLFLDEDQALLNYLSELLAPHFSVACASSASEATSMIAYSDFDVIVASAIGGMALYSRVQELKPELRDHFIFTSGSDAEAAMVAASGRVVLRKPVRLDQWDLALLRVLKAARPIQFRSVESVFLL